MTDVHLLTDDLPTGPFCYSYLIPTGVPQIFGGGFGNFVITLRDGTADSVSITISVREVIFAMLRNAWHRYESLTFKDTIWLYNS
jgi:hypothetical protein